MTKAPVYAIIQTMKEIKGIEIMKYYQISTPTAIVYIKTKETIRNKEQARKIVGGPVNWISFSGLIPYYFHKIFDKKG